MNLRNSLAFTSALAVLAASLPVLPSLSVAQAQAISVVASCGAESLPVGRGGGSLFITPDGNLCTSGSGGGGGATSLTAFRPTGNTTLAASGTTNRAALPSADTTILVQNPGVTGVWVKLGDASVNATTGDFFIQAGAALPLYSAGDTYLAAITSGASTTLYISSGTGTAYPSAVMDPTASVTVQQATAANLKAHVEADGSVAGGTASAFSMAAGGVFNTTNPTLTNGQQAALQFTSRGLVQAATCDANGCTATTNTVADALGTSRASFVIPFNFVRDASNWSMQRGIGGSFGSALGVTATEAAGAPFSNITTNTTTTVKSGAGILHKVCINTKGASANTATIFDNTAGSGTKMGTLDTTADTACKVYDAAFATGLTVVTATGTAADLTVVYR